MLPRGGWVEWESTDPDEMVMVHPGWTNDTETLILGVRETGWFGNHHAVYEAVENAELSFGWLGVGDDGELYTCTAKGFRDDEDDEPLSDVGPVTFAKLGLFSALAPRRTSNRDW